MVKYTPLLLTLTALVSRITADCQVDLSSTGSITVGDTTIAIGDVVTDKAICLGQGSGSDTFAMVAEETATGLPNAGGTGAQPATIDAQFLIMDNSCKLQGFFFNPGCGIPWGVRAPFLKYELSVTTVDMDPNAPDYVFKYANGQYSIRNNGCVCNKMSSAFNSAYQGCRCAFPVAGEPTRKLAFKA